MPMHAFNESHFVQWMVQTAKFSVISLIILLYMHTNLDAYVINEPAA